MVFFRAFLIIIFLIIIQSSLVVPIQIKGVAPDFVMIFIVFWCGQKSRYQGVILGFVGGLLQDLMNGDLLGASALSRSIACYLSCSFPWNHYEQNTLTFGLILSTATFAYQIIYLIVISRNAANGFMTLFLRYGIPTVLYTVLCGILIRSLIVLLEKRYNRNLA